MDAEQGGTDWPKAETCDAVLLVRSSDFRWEAIAFVILRAHALSLVGNTSNAEEALRIASKRAPDLVLLGADLPNIDIVAFAVQLQAAAPLCKIVVLGDELDHELLFALVLQPHLGDRGGEWEHGTPRRR